MGGLKERKMLTLNNFLGVDFSSSPLNATYNRAVEMENLINADGVTRKREGWENLLNLEEGRINGIYEYEYGGEHSVIVHAGRWLYSLDGDTLEPRDGVRFRGAADSRSRFFFNNGRVFIVCGEYVVYKGKDEGFALVCDEAYIPTTTAKPILHKTSYVSFNSLKGIEAKEEINTLTRKRTNEFYFADDLYSIAKEKGAVWLVLDTKAMAGEFISISLPDFSMNGIKYSGVSFTVIAPREKDEEELYYGGVKFGAVKAHDKDNCSLVELLFVEPCEMAEQKDPIRVTYYAEYEGDDPSYRIRKCTLATLFGPDGASDRLFLTGSPERKNAVYYSAYNDFTYFPDLNYVTVGDADDKISGFLRLIDSAMAMFKNGVRGDANVYYLTGTLKESYDTNGEVIDGDAEFYVKMGGLGSACLSPYATANLSGDSLMLSEDGVCGVTLLENVSVNARYTAERSFNINERLRRQGKAREDAVAIVYKNRYYLSVAGVCYVADQRFKFKRDNGDGSFNYEWWYWTNIPARCFAVIGDRLFFGTDDGRVCAFKENGCYDEIMCKIDDAGLLVSVEDNGIIFDSALDEKISDGDEITFFDADGFYSFVASLHGDVLSDGFTVADNPSLLREGEQILLGYAEDGGGVCIVAKARIGEISFGDGRTEISELEWSENAATEGKALGIYRELGGRRLYVTQKGVTDEGYPCFKLRYTPEGEEVDIASYDADGRYTVALRRKTPVRALWVTPYFDMGSNMYSKTLLRMTLCANGEGVDTVRFGYQTKQTDAMRSNKGSGYLDFEALDFKDFSMDTAGANSYTVKVNVRNFNYVRFRFVSNTEGSCAINNFSALYKINGINRGVR